MFLDSTAISDRLANAANPRHRRQIVKELAATHNCSVQSIYKAASRAGFTAGRKKRSDAGKRILPITDAQLMQIAATIHKTHTEKGRIPMSAQTAIQLAESEGIIEPGILTEAYLNEWLRSRSISKAEVLGRTPHTRLMTTHPNHVHMVDASVCVQWYLAEDETVKHQRRDMDVYKNKEGKPNKITRLLVVDHYTGAFYVQYIDKDENTDIVLEFLYRAWADKTFLAQELSIETEQPINTLFPFRGMPDIIYSDNGSPFKSKLYETVMDLLSIKVMRHKPGNARAKGANEGLHRHWERWFESKLKLRPATSIEEINKYAFDVCLQINSLRKHSRHGMTRFEFFAKACEGHIRDVPDYIFFREFKAYPAQQRRIGMDGIINFTPQGKKVPFKTSGQYRFPDVEFWGKNVEVSYCLHDYPTIRAVVRKGAEVIRYDLKPLAQNEAGFIPSISATIGQNYKDNKKTTIERQMEEIAKVEVITPKTLELPNYELPVYNSQPATTFDVKPAEITKMYSRLQAQRILMSHINITHISQALPEQQEVFQGLPQQVSYDLLEASKQHIAAFEKFRLSSMEGGA